ncbi:hypothetical protein SUGI_1200780 [Cryptomeria japonica]|nr:hypothetical protein SUGI_1200780 [Cryptomeria japonica]
MLQGVLERDKPLAIKEIHHYDFSRCNSPKSILDANSQFSESTSFSSEDLDASEGSSLSEEDLSYFKELLSFALESPPSSKKSVSKSEAGYNYGSDNHGHDDKTYTLFPSSAPCPPLMNSQPSGNIYRSFNSFTDRPIAVPPYPAMDSLKKDSLNCPAKIPAFEASHKCSVRSPQYTYPCPLFSAMENQLGYIKDSNFPISPKPEINMKPPNFPIFRPPSSAVALLNYYERNNMAGPFNNVGILPIWYSDPYRPPPPLVNHCSAPVPFKVPSNRFTNGGEHNLQQLLYNFRKSKANSGYSIETFERELQELLRGRRKPIRISVLPAMYEERFHRPINSSHEKLTALLSKCRNIVLVYRQGGQHVMMLKHDESVPAAKVSRRTNRSLDPRSRKVYLTFPPGSTFTSDDAEAYFRQFGAVRGVRMSHEEPPTYAFVEFYTCEGALSALCNTKAHSISGQKVMVKPYRQSQTS